MKRYMIALALMLSTVVAVNAESSWQTAAENFLNDVKQKIDQGMQGLGEAVSSSIGEPQNVWSQLKDAYNKGSQEAAAKLEKAYAQALEKMTAAQQKVQQSVDTAIQKAIDEYQNAVKQQQATFDLISAKVREAADRKQVASQQLLSDVQKQYELANKAINQSLEKMRTSYEAAEKLARSTYDQAVADAQQAKAQLDSLKAQANNSSLVKGAQQVYEAAQQRVANAKASLANVMNQASEAANRLNEEGAKALKSLEQKASSLTQLVKDQPAQQGFSNTLASIKEKAQAQMKAVTDWVTAQKQKLQGLK